MDPEHVAASFVSAINSGRVDALSELMTDDYVFIDSDGTEVTGRHRMREGWTEYFKMVPDYRITVDVSMARGDTVALLGRAEGTFSRQGELSVEHHWSVPAAWRAVVDGARVAVWQVYVNPEPMTRALERMEQG